MRTVVLRERGGEDERRLKGPVQADYLNSGNQQASCGSDSTRMLHCKADIRAGECDRRHYGPGAPRGATLSGLSERSIVICKVDSA